MPLWKGAACPEYVEGLDAPCVGLFRLRPVGRDYGETCKPGHGKAVSSHRSPITGRRKMTPTLVSQARTRPAGSFSLLTNVGKIL